MCEAENAILEKHRIHEVPPSMFYIPNFITEDEEAYILNKASKIPSN